MSERVLADVRAVLEAEKPAHTDYAIAVIEPTMRLNVQARLGVDAVLADADTPDPDDPDAGLQLAGDMPVRLDDKARIGINTSI